MMMKFTEMVKLRKVLSDYDLTIFQLEALVAVSKNEGCTVTEILNRGYMKTNNSMSTITTQIKRLAEGTNATPGKNLIKRIVCSYNAKASELYLTEKGKDTLSKMLQDLQMKI